MATTHELTVFEDSGFSLMARVTGNDAENIQQADISSISYYVEDLDDDDATPATGTLTVADVVFDTLQTDARWDEDATGYNFRWDVPASLVATGNHRYVFEIKFTPASGEPFHVRAKVTAAQILGS